MAVRIVNGEYKWVELPRGGVREGAGRPKIGEKKPVSITLPSEDWEKIQELIVNGHASSLADYFRQLHQTHGTG